MSLRKDIEALKIGESITIEGTRALAYTAAARAGVTISTKETYGGSIIITRKENEPVGAAVANQKHSTSLEIALASVLSLSTKDRLELLGHLELCCGMNRGECVCVPEEIEVERPQIDKKQALLADLRGKIGVIESGYGKIPVPEGDSEEKWVFSRDKTWYNDDGNAYRRQILAPEGKVSRTVQVDEEDPGRIVKILG